jgi:deazaflavin-dependent oxidoreductase (nitroreductase family)
MALEPDLAQRAVCDLETVGRRTGLPRLIEIWFAAHPVRDRIYVLSGGRDRADWVRNLRRNPAVRVRIAGLWFTGRAAEVGADPTTARRDGFWPPSTRAGRRAGL